MFIRYSSSERKGKGRAGRTFFLSSFQEGFCRTSPPDEPTLLMEAFLRSEENGLDPGPPPSMGVLADRKDDTEALGCWPGTTPPTTAEGYEEGCC